MAAGLAHFEREDVIFRPGEGMRTKLAQLGVVSIETGEGVCELASIVELNDDEADDLEAFIAGSASGAMPARCNALTRPH